MLTVSGRRSKYLIWVPVLAVLLVVASFFVDEPLRKSMERRMNQSLKGYTVQIAKLHLSPFSLSVTLRDLVLRQQANPEPAVLVVPRLKASVQWREVFTGHLVADFLLDQPRLNVNLAQLRQENSDPTPVKDKGWQDAIAQIYPLKINLLRVTDGDFVYIDDDPKQSPLHVEHLALLANNIRNIRSREHVYPSPFHAEAVVFGTGSAVVDGFAGMDWRPVMADNPSRRSVTPTPTCLHAAGERTSGYLQTGQVTCHDTSGREVPCAGSGQDGEFRKGAICPQGAQATFSAYTSSGSCSPRRRC